MRIRFLLDSTGQNINGVWTKIMCPELLYDSGRYFGDYDYDCPNRTNPFLVAWRFFRLVYSDADFKGDWDGLSANLRLGS